MLNSNIMPGMGLADPHAIVEGDTVYIMCGSDKSPKTEDTWRMDKWMILSSKDLINWKLEGEILPKDTYIGDCDENCWAGFNYKKNDKFYWFFSNKDLSIGVMTADKPEGPYVDALKKPLIPEGFSKTKSYDPCVYCEGDDNIIVFGVNHYYYAELSEDLLSVTSEAKPLLVFDKDGNEVITSDKSTVFKHKGRYYLCYGAKYAIADNVRGPYTFMGEFIGGGHNDVFTFKDKLYICNEFHDTNIFYRGIRVMELNFNEDGTVVLPEYNPDDIILEKKWDFSEYNQNFFLTNMEDCEYINGYIKYNTDASVGFRSPVFPGVLMKEDGNFEILIDNIENADSLIIEIQIVDNNGCYWFGEPRYQKIEIKLKDGEGKYSFPVTINEKESVLRQITIYGSNLNINKEIHIKSMKYYL